MLKKNIFIFMFIIAILILQSCVLEPEGYKFNYDELKANVVSVELICYDNFDAQIIERKNVKKPFDFMKMSVVEEMDKTRLDEFISDLSNIDITMFDYMSETPIGESIRINYKSGDFIVMSEVEKGEKTWRFVGVFNTNGELIKAIGGLWWSNYSDIVNKYFNYKIE